MQHVYLRPPLLDESRCRRAWWHRQHSCACLAMKCSWPAASFPLLHGSAAACTTLFAGAAAGALRHMCAAPARTGKEPVPISWQASAACMPGCDLRHVASRLQVMYTTAFSTSISFMGAVGTNQLIPSIAFVFRNPDALWYILALCASSAAMQVRCMRPASCAPRSAPLQPCRCTARARLLHTPVYTHAPLTHASTLCAPA